MSEREEKFEKMLQAVQEEYGTVSEKMETLKAEGKTYHRDGVSLAGKGCRLLPYPGVERHGKVFDYDENLAVHGKNCARPREVTRSRRSERLQSYDIFARIANNPYGRGLGQTAISCRDFHNIGRYRS